MYPKAIAKANGPDERYIWVFGEGTNPRATIAKDKPTDDKDTRPLQALIAHLDLEEWDEL